jgi:hypothetical protein
MNRATQDEVKAQLGAPDETRSLPDGGVEWHYHYRRARSMVGPHGTTGSATSLECKEYAVQFSEAGVLRAWVQRMELTCEPHSRPSLSPDMTARG